MEDTDGFKEMMRIDFEHFKEILNLTYHIILQQIAARNKVISTAERLDLTIQFLAMSEPFK